MRLPTAAPGRPDLLVEPAPTGRVQLMCLDCQTSWWAEHNWSLHTEFDPCFICEQPGVIYDRRELEPLP